MRNKNRRILKALSAVLICIFFAFSMVACRFDDGDSEKPSGGRFDNFKLSETDKSWRLVSTDQKLSVNVYYWQKRMVYEVTFGGKEVICKSMLGLKTGWSDFTQDLLFVGEKENRDVEISYTTITGKKSIVETEYNELIINLKKGAYDFDIIMRAYNDGFAFRYNLNSVIGTTERIDEEVSEFALPMQAQLFYQEADISKDYFSYEESYTTRLNAEKNGLRGVQAAMPVLYETKEGVWALLTEADIYGHDYIGTFLGADANDGVLQTVPAYGSETSVEVSLPFESPWRVGVVGGLDTVVESTLVEDVYGEVEYWKPDNYDELSEEEKAIYNYDWVTPGAAAWDWLMNQNSQGDYEMHLEYLDFAIENNLKWIILDGGWTPSSPEAIKLYKKLVKTAHENNIKVMVWAWAHTNAGTLETLVEQLDKWKSIGIDGLKMDYFDGQFQNTSARVDSQETLQMTERLYQECAKRKMVLNCHGCNKPTGERRIYPHVFNREAIRGNENMTNSSIFDLVTMPFIRGTIGPSDYTPTLIPTGEQSTCGSQLALHILLETGSISLADEISVYNNSVAKDFVMGLPVRYDDVKLLEGNPRTHCIMMRTAGENFYLAGITMEGRECKINLSFLEEGKTYIAEIYYDKQKNISGTDEWSPIIPLSGTQKAETSSLLKREQKINRNSLLQINTIDRGGFAIKITEIK